ncbi:pseudouridine synthase [Streptococcus sp. DD13]|uniref:pseudouridine synthase n=1 Tax=Streptococcus sp. DD13 TaxID=1777881 RepID=UPI000792673A|nr:pseudouridine synthase [Streptococcus sp. DD13]KXT78491.1 Ribosomal small subunit pseudouridine synthase A [Streptococcus sp. DD13]
MRLDKLLRAQGYGSRKDVKKLIQRKQVVIDGIVCQKEGQNVDPQLQEIHVSGKRIRNTETVYYLLNKPQGVVAACSDREHPTVLDCIRKEDYRPGLYPIGRLDRDTEGLTLITNNGPLGYRMLHPDYHVEKMYLVKVNGMLEPDAVDFFKAGVLFLDGVRCQPAKLTIVQSGKEESVARLTIREGKFHQVKKMFLAYGLKVIYLKRERFGPFQIGNLEAGAYRTLTKEEGQVLKEFLD